MAEHDDHPSENWGNDVAKWTLVFTAALTLLYVAAVIVFIH